MTGTNGETPPPGDAALSPGGDTRWMSYTELADALGIKRASAKRIAMRHRWQRQQGNDATARVAVPVTVLDDSRKAVAGDGKRQSPDDRAASPATERRHPDDKSLSVTALAAAVDALREAKDSEIATLHGVIEGLRDNVARSVALLDLERARGDRAERERNAADTDRRAAEAAREAERTRADALRDRIMALLGELDQATRQRQEAETLGEADAARRLALGRWARLRRAWRGD
jgi:hypothetical protein